MSFSSVTLPGGVGGAPQFGGGTGDAFNDSSCESPTPFQNGTRQVGPNSPVGYSESPYDTLEGPFLPCCFVCVHIAGKENSTTS